MVPSWMCILEGIVHPNRPPSASLSIITSHVPECPKRHPECANNQHPECGGTYCSSAASSSWWWECIRCCYQKSSNGQCFCGDTDDYGWHGWSSKCDCDGSNIGSYMGCAYAHTGITAGPTATTWDAIGTQERICSSLLRRGGGACPRWSVPCCDTTIRIFIGRLRASASAAMGLATRGARTYDRHGTSSRCLCKEKDVGSYIRCLYGFIA